MSEYADSLESFFVLPGVNAVYADFQLNQIAVLAKTDSEAKEELYNRISPAIDRLVSYYKARHSRMDEGIAYYDICMVTERVIKKFDPEQGRFLNYWSSCAKKGLVGRCQKSEARPIAESFDEESVSAEEGGRMPGFEKEILLDRLLFRLDGKRTPRSLCVILKIAGYSLYEIAEMVGLTYNEVLSAMRRLRKLKI